MTRRALTVADAYEALERRTYGRPWSLPEHEGELADALWSLIVIAHRCGVDLATAFARTTDELDERLARPAGGAS